MVHGLMASLAEIAVSAVYSVRSVDGGENAGEGIDYPQHWLPDNQSTTS